MFVKLITKIKLAWISFQIMLSDLSDEPTPRAFEHRQKMRENYKLMKGIKKMNDYLRGLSPAERRAHIERENANLLSEMPAAELSPYEKAERLRLQAYVLSNPTNQSGATESDFVDHVVKNREIYAKEHELRELRRKSTELRRTMNNDRSAQAEFVRVSKEIKRLSNDIRLSKQK